MLKYFLPGLIFSLLISSAATAQPANVGKTETAGSKQVKILTSGKRINIQSKKMIKSVMVWTSAGHRYIEQKDINADHYSFTIAIPEKIFFLRVDFEDGSLLSQKIGIL